MGADVLDFGWERLRLRFACCWGSFLDFIGWLVEQISWSITE